MFAQNTGFVKHLLLPPKAPTPDEDVRPGPRFASFEKCRVLRRSQYAEALLQPQGRGPISLTIPFEFIDQDWSLVFDILLAPTVESFAINNHHCEILVPSSVYACEI
jgi:hypothetical protein